MGNLGLNDIIKAIREHQTDFKDCLIDECEIITRYLVNQSPSHDLIQRYINANAILLAGDHSPSDTGVVAFVRKNPWALPYLDAVSGMIRPNSLLRSKILLMIAILEATPQFTEFFFPKALSSPRFLGEMVGYGASSTWKLLIGCFIYLLAMRAK